MKDKRFNFIAGACFGYFDQTFPECVKCKFAEPCYNATHSEKVQEIRSIPKTDVGKVRKLVHQFEPKDRKPSKAVPEFKKQELFQDGAEND